MKKEKIRIGRIRNDQIFEKLDETASEEKVSFILKSGEKVTVTCTPEDLEEMILGHRYLLGDVASEEIFETKDSYSSLEEVSLEEIFCVAKESFENPGPLFVDTGCAHSCALVYQGKVMCCIEDIGRHNALDKVVGFALLNQIPFAGCYIFTSGRISEDYLQKVVAAGFPMAVSRAAVTANAAALAKEKNVTLLGFIRKESGNLYHEGKVKICKTTEGS